MKNSIGDSTACGLSAPVISRDEGVFVWLLSLITSTIAVAALLMVTALLMLFSGRASAGEPAYIYRIPVPTDQLTIVSPWEDYLVMTVDGVQAEARAFVELRLMVQATVPVPAYTVAHGYPQTLRITLAPNGMTGDYETLVVENVESDHYYLLTSQPIPGCGELEQ